MLHVSKIAVRTHEMRVKPALLIRVPKCREK